MNEENFDQFRFIANNRPMDFEKIMQVYKSDPTFHQFVDSIYDFIDKLQLSPQEVRSATMFACYKHEMMTVKPILRGLK